MIGSEISVSDFADECERWMEKRYPRRDDSRTARFSWRERSDDVSLFEDAYDEASIREVADLRAWRSALDEADLAWITGPPRYGGRGLTPDHQRAFDRVVKEFEVPSNRHLMISLGMVAPTILDHGSEVQKSLYLRDMHAGRTVACQLFSEPGAGSDLGAASTRVIRDGGGWRITGQKVWTSGAHYSDIGEALCRTGAGSGRDCFTIFIVDMNTPGVTVRPLRQMTGGAAFNEVFFDDVWVDDDQRLGDIGGGWTVMLTTLSRERRSIGGSGFGGVGILDVQRHVEMVLHHGRAVDPVVRSELADLVCNLWVAKFNERRAAANRARGRPGPEGSLTKLALTRNYRRIERLVGDIIGPSLVADTGEWGTYSWASFILGVPGMRVGGGTDEILMNAIAERQLGLPREPRSLQ